MGWLLQHNAAACVDRPDRKGHFLDCWVCWARVHSCLSHSLSLEIGRGRVFLARKDFKGVPKDYYFYHNIWGECVHTHRTWFRMFSKVVFPFIQGQAISSHLLGWNRLCSVHLLVFFCWCLLQLQVCSIGDTKKPRETTIMACQCPKVPSVCLFLCASQSLYVFVKNTFPIPRMFLSSYLAGRTGEATPVSYPQMCKSHLSERCWSLIIIF